MCKLNEKVNENVNEEELKGIILERIGELKNKFPDVEKLEKMDIHLIDYFSPSPIYMDENKLMVSTSLINDIPLLNFCLVFAAKCLNYSEEFKKVPIEDRTFFNIATCYKINSQLRKYLNKDFKMPKESFDNPMYDNLSLNEIYDKVKVEYKDYV